jgi:hypothetical protein
MPPLLPNTKAGKRECQFIAECLLKAANLVDAFDDGLEPIIHPCTNPYVNAEEMAVRWQWALLCLIDHLDLPTADVRGLAHAISAVAQDSLPI